MIKVKKRKTIKNLSNKSLMANKTRNIIAVAARALTALLFTSLFTIAISINEGFQQNNFRQIGEQQIGKSHSAPKSKENPGPDIIQEKIQSCGNGIEDHYSRNLQIPGSFKEKGSPKEKA